MPEENADYLASGSGEKPANHEHLEMLRALLSEEAMWSDPPPEVGDAILESIAAETVTAEAHTEASQTRLAWVAAIAAAAIVAAVLGLWAVLGSRAEEIVVPIAGTDLQASATGEATLRPTGDGWWIQLDVTDLTPAPEGTYYEGWLWNEDGEGVSIGTFHLRGKANPVVLWSGVSPADYPSIWVTLEDEDGDPSASGRVVMKGQIPAESLP